MVEAETIFVAVAYNAFLLVGSVSVGYVFLRVTQPDVRTLSPRKKFFRSLALGALFVAIALGAEALVLDSSKILSLQSLTPILASIVVGASITVFNVASGLRQKEFVEVGVPLPRRGGGVKKLLPFVQAVLVKPPEAAPSPPPVAPSLALPVPPPPLEKKKTIREKLAELKAKGVIKKEEEKAPLPEEPKPKKGFFEKLFAKQEQKPGKKVEAMIPPTIPLPPQPAAPITLSPEELEKMPRYKRYLAQKEVEARTLAPPALEKRGFFQRLFGKRAAMRPAPLVPRKPSEEAEIEVMLKELRLITPAAPPSPAAARGVARGTAPAPTTRRRLYLEKRAAKEAEAALEAPAGAPPVPGAPGKPRYTKLEQLKAAKREREELQTLFQDLYAQMVPAPGVKVVRAPPKPVPVKKGAPPAPAPEVGVKELFEESAPAPSKKDVGAPAAPTGVFAELQAISEGKKKEERAGERIKPEIAVVKMQVTPGMPGVSCPHCGAKSIRVIFCPYCGNGMCANCTPSLKPTLDEFIYQCPKCGEDVSLKRKAAAEAAVT